jgi:class 3 adenylate cyclase
MTANRAATAKRQHGVIGEASNLAGRLQAMAKPGAILLDQQTRRLVGGIFDYSELDLREVRRFGEPVPVWQVLRPSQAESRFEALRGPALTPLVGHQHRFAGPRSRRDGAAAP